MTTTADPAETSTSLRIAHLRYEDVIDQLIQPLPAGLIEVRPGATTKDKKKAIALAYYDWRIMVNRFNVLIGGRNWSVHLEPWGANKLICELTILGITKVSTGEAEASDENAATSAEAQAKKRAFAEHGFNYLYLLPQVWGEYDAEKKRFTNPQALVEEMYRKAKIEGLNLLSYLGTGARVPVSTVSSRSDGHVPPPTSESVAAPSSPTGALVEERQKESLRKLCEALKKEQPDYSTLTASEAAKLLTTLTNEYRAARARQQAVAHNTTNARS